LDQENNSHCSGAENGSIYFAFASLKFIDVYKEVYLIYFSKIYDMLALLAAADQTEMLSSRGSVIHDPLLKAPVVTAKFNQSLKKSVSASSLATKAKKMDLSYVLGHPPNPLFKSQLTFKTSVHSASAIEELKYYKLNSRVYSVKPDVERLVQLPESASCKEVASELSKTSIRFITSQEGGPLLFPYMTDCQVVSPGAAPGSPEMQHENDSYPEPSQFNQLSLASPIDSQITESEQRRRSNNASAINAQCNVIQPIPLSQHSISGSVASYLEPGSRALSATANIISSSNDAFLQQQLEQLHQLPRQYVATRKRCLVEDCTNGAQMCVFGGGGGMKV
jgi:hypothetical protein